MNSFEKKVHDLYQQKKREDEKSIPRFDSFSSKTEAVKKLRHSYFFLKVAAAVALVAVATSYYLFTHRLRAEDTVKTYPVNLNQHLPTQSLMDKGTGTGYIWNWKAPTDLLLNDAKNSLRTKI